MEINISQVIHICKLGDEKPVYRGNVSPTGQITWAEKATHCPWCGDTFPVKIPE